MFDIIIKEMRNLIANLSFAWHICTQTDSFLYRVPSLGRIFLGRIFFWLTMKLIAGNNYVLITRSSDFNNFICDIY